jgi:hypothetical protein
VITPVHFTFGTTTAESLVRHPLGLDLLGSPQRWILPGKASRSRSGITNTARSDV